MFQQELGFTCRSWVIWYYTFGVNCKKKFSRIHAHLFHFVKDPKRVHVQRRRRIRVPSARQLVYADAGRNPDGRLPDDTWILRPQDLAGRLPPTRTPGTSRASAARSRSGPAGTAARCPSSCWAGSSAPARNPGELVLDPFAGSGTTLAVGQKLGRRYLGFELSPEYAAQDRKATRIDRAGDPLDGAAEPLMSAQGTADGVRLGGAAP